jgi:tRNA(fMet)-specific endonuclease VapC
VTDAILDTTFFIDLRNKDRGAEDLWHKITVGSASASYSTLTAFELWVGRKFDDRRESFYLQTFRFLEEVRLTRRAASLAGAWLREFPRESRNSRLRDALIAASPLERNETIVTRNVRDFLRFPGVRVESY